MEPKNVNDAVLEQNGVVIQRKVQVMELGTDSKRLLIEIRDRLPAATPPPLPADVRPWEIFGPREQAVLHAWVGLDNQVVWIKRGGLAAEGYRRLYVADVS